MKRYVLGFAFDTYGERVVLIEKQKPTWQAGKYNGVGGKIEENEDPIDAMVREFEEETGVATEDTDWKLLGYMGGPDWSCDVFYFHDADVCGNVGTTTDEKVGVFPVNQLPAVISNLNWLIPAANNHKYNEGDFYLEVKY